MAKKESDPTAEVMQALLPQSTTDPTNIKKVSEYVRTGRRWDATHSDVQGKLLIMHRYRDIETKYGPACLVDLDCEGNEMTVLFGGKVLIDQVRQIGVNFPCVAVIRKPARAYGLFDPTDEEKAAYVRDYVKSA